ncbi:unnamed protein product [Paramecium pentaurelia]|uniref:Uncharacterized protein n=1 Tax=Paramecium pentaurelia TaxID=43138 RepID=A0A8S1RUM6_9CILI|nr:unnamed protein product [Paramecium pentaurelia]
MQYQQGNINAEYLSDKGQYQQPPQGGYQYQPIQGQPVIGQPVQQQYQYNPQTQIQYPQQPYAQYAQYPQRVQYGNGYQQQMVVLPQTALVVAVQPINPIVAKEMALRSYTRYFYGCNCCIGVLAMIFLIIRCVAAFQQGGSEVAAGVIDFFFVTGAICGIYSISRYVERLLLHYQVLLVIALVFEIIGSIIIFATYSDNEDDDHDEEDSYTKNDKDNRRSVGLIFFIVSLIIVVICYGMFIRYARQIRYMMIDLNITRANLQNQNIQQGPLQNQGVVYGGAPQI